MATMSLDFAQLLKYLRQAIAAMRDPRQASNNQHYSLADIVLGAFSVFFMQCESFLEHQRQMQSRQGKNNATTLFGLKQIPTVPQMRNVLDEIEASQLFGVFERVYQVLRQGGWFQRYRVFQGGFLITLDGTEYFRSHKLHCEQCSHRQHGNGVVDYFHNALLPVLVAPGVATVLSLAPEFITPQDGALKQDCEVTAAKRWIGRSGSMFAGERVTLLGDDLYSHQPMCERVLQAGMHFIFNCLPESHPLLYEWLTALEHLGEVHSLEVKEQHLRQRRCYRYRYAQQVPLRDSDASLLVNWCEVEVWDEVSGERLYHNSWVTDHELTALVVPEVVRAGRSRWKTENENHNVLKTKCYHLEHNFGHGKHHLSQTLLTLNILAFLFHTVLELVDQSYQKIRAQRVTRRGFFQDMCSLTKYLLFESWQGLIDFMLEGEPSPQIVNSS